MMEGSAGGNWPVDQQQQQPPPPPQPHTAYPPIPPPPHLSSQTHHHIPSNNSSYNYPNSFYHHPNSLPSSSSDAAAAAAAAAAANLQHLLYYYNHPVTSSTITHDYAAASGFSDPATIAASLGLQGFENVDPVAYQIALLTAQSGLDPAFTNASAGVWNQTYSKFKGGLAGKFPKKKKSKIVQSAYCATCKIDCNCIDAYRKHIVGKKHLKNIKLLEESKKQKTNPTSAAPTAPGKTRANSMSDQGKSNANCPSVPVGTNSNTNVLVEKHTFEPATKEELEIKRQKVLNQGAAAAGVRICTLCNTVCNSEIVFSIHLAGKKHALMLQKQLNG